MKLKGNLLKSKFKWWFIFFLLSACVERIDFEVPTPEFQTVVEGFISDIPGEYIVKVTKGLALDADSSFREPITKVKIKLYDDQGNVENFVETIPGEYHTGGAIVGQVGHSYHISLETQDGKLFESDPDELKAGGELKNIRFEFEARTIVETFGEQPADVFNVYVDANAGIGNDNYVRWRYTGTYRVFTNPELHETWVPPYTPYKNPPPCSGYVVKGGPDFSGGILEQVGPCTCCICWANHFEAAPQLSDVQLVSGNQFNNVKVGEVPITNATFYDKYMVEVEQMSLSRKAFEFFKLIREQKQGVASLFQPPSGEIKGNVRSVNSSNPVIGFFWATSTTKKTIFIHRSDVPYPVTPIDFVREACTVYPNSLPSKPTNWDE